MPPIAFHDRVLIVGKTTGGKSTVARMLAARFAGGCRIVVCDPKGRTDVGVEPVRDVELIDPAAPVVRFVPRTLDRSVFEAFYFRVWLLGGPTVLWDDEAAATTTGNYAPRYSDVYQQQGGQLQKGRLIVSQRPVSIAVNLRSEAEHVIVMVPPPYVADLKVLAAEMAVDPFELGAQMRDLQQHEGAYAFVWWDRATGEITPCAPLDPAWVHAPMQG